MDQQSEMDSRRRQERDDNLFKLAVEARDYVRYRALAREATLQGMQFEREAERCRMEAQRAFEDVAAMKAEGRARQAREYERMLPQHERATDVRTGTMKAMADAKADHVYYSTQAATYANLAAMKYAKASAIMAQLP